MNLVPFYKASVAVMTILLLAGFTFIIYKLSDKNFQSKLKTKNIVIKTEQSVSANLPTSVETTKTNRFLTADEDIFSILTCGEHICVTVKNKTDNYRLIVLHPQSGRLINEVFLK